ncbi:MAG: 4-hydroxy-tetrahydrodipicolinate reductase [Nitrospinaceae bacterium]
MVKVAVVGAAGRMGKTIVACIEEHPQAVLAGGTERAGHPAMGRDIGEAAGIGRKDFPLQESLDAVLPGADVVIDFSTPASSLTTLDRALHHRKAVVFGTTGFSAEEKTRIAQAARDLCIVQAPNMSIGVNVLFKLVAEAARALGDAYDVEIVEAHHKFKKDAPSGTAVRLAEIAAEALGRDLKKVGIYGRRGFSDGRDPQEIGIHTLRAGDIVGDHRVLFGGMGETLEVCHRAQSRDTFARGAVRAAVWLGGRSPGLYDMQDVLGLRTTE